jgi:hypothetical protein
MVGATGFVVHSKHTDSFWAAKVLPGHCRAPKYCSWCGLVEWKLFINPGTNCSLNTNDFDINSCRLETLTPRTREEAQEKNQPTRSKKCRNTKPNLLKKQHVELSKKSKYDSSK